MLPVSSNLRFNIAFYEASLFFHTGRQIPLGSITDDLPSSAVYVIVVSGGVLAVILLCLLTKLCEQIEMQKRKQRSSVTTAPA